MPKSQSRLAKLKRQARLAICLGVLTCIPAVAFIVHEIPEGKVIEIQSQEELAENLNGINLSDSTPVYLLINSGPFNNSSISALLSGCQGCSIRSNVGKCCCCKDTSGEIIFKSCSNSPGVCPKTYCGPNTRVGCCGTPDPNCV